MFMRNSYSCFQEHFRFAGCKGKAICGVGKKYQEVYHRFVTTRTATCDRIGERGLFGVASAATASHWGLVLT